MFGEALASILVVIPGVTAGLTTDLILVTVRCRMKRTVRYRAQLLRFAGVLVLVYGLGSTEQPLHAYEGDHYAWTYYVALQCGFSEQQSYQIASGAYAIDWDSETGPMPAGFDYAQITWGYPPESIRLIWVRYHAFTERQFQETGGGLAVEAAKKRHMARLWLVARLDGNPGALLHYVQDYSPHYGWNDIRGHGPASHLPDYLVADADGVWKATERTMKVLKDFRNDVGMPSATCNRARLRTVLDRLIQANPLPVPAEDLVGTVADLRDRVNSSTLERLGPSDLSEPISVGLAPVTVPYTLAELTTVYAKSGISPAGMVWLLRNDLGPSLDRSLAVIREAVAEDKESGALDTFVLDDVPSFELPKDWIKYDYDSEGHVSDPRYTVEQPTFQLDEPSATYQLSGEDGGNVHVYWELPVRLEGVKSLGFVDYLPVELQSHPAADTIYVTNGNHSFTGAEYFPRSEIEGGTAQLSFTVAVYGIGEQTLDYPLKADWGGRSDSESSGEGSDTDESSADLPDPAALAAAAANAARTAAESALSACERVTSDIKAATSAAASIGGRVAEIESGLGALEAQVDGLDGLVQQAQSGAADADTAARELADIRDRLAGLRGEACSQAEAIAGAATSEQQNSLLGQVRSAVAEATSLATRVPGLLSRVANGAREASQASQQAAGLREELEAIATHVAELGPALGEAQRALDRAHSTLAGSATASETILAAQAQAESATALANASGDPEVIAETQRLQAGVAAAAEAVRQCRESASPQIDQADSAISDLDARSNSIRDRLAAARARLAGGDLATIAAAAAEADATLVIAEPFAESILGRADEVAICAEIAEGNALAPPSGGDPGGSDETGDDRGSASGTGWTSTSGVETVDAAGGAGESTDPVSDPVIDGLIAQAGDAFARCDFAAARAFADRIAARDPDHPWLGSNYAVIVANEKRQRAAVAALRRAEAVAASGSLADLAAARAAAQEAATLAPFCLVDQVTSLVSTIDGHLGRARDQERAERRERNRGGLAEGLGSLIGAIGAVAAVVSGGDVVVPPVSTSPGGGSTGGGTAGPDLADPCTYKWSFSSVYATEPTCDCAGYSYRGVCVRDPGAGGGGAGGGTEPVTDKDEGTVSVSSRNARVCVTDINSVLDDQYDLYVNNGYVGSIANPEGGSTCYNAMLRGGSNGLELRLVAARGKSTRLQISINGSEYASEFSGTHNHVWTVVAP